MAMSANEEKSALRARTEAILRGLDAEAFKREGALAAAALGREARWSEARTVLAFLSMRGEIVSDLVVDAAFLAGKRVALPRVEDGELSFREAASLDGPWAQGPFGIREPLADASRVDFDALPGPILVIAPGLAFDKNGGRLGHGKGYYDRFLRGLRSRRSDVFVTALCVPRQIMDLVPMDERDERMDAVCAGGSYFPIRSPA